MSGQKERVVAHYNCNLKQKWERPTRGSYHTFEFTITMHYIAGGGRYGRAYLAYRTSAIVA